MTTNRSNYGDPPSSLAPPHADLLARVFASVSDPTRVRILLLVLERERNVSELVSLVDISQGRVSTHLQCLRWCGFVTSERRGKFVYYQVVDPHVRQLLQIAEEMVVTYGQQLAGCAVLQDEHPASAPSAGLAIKEYIDA